MAWRCPPVAPASNVDGDEAPTGRERLLVHRAANAGACESRRVWLYHAHAYFDHTLPHRVAEARAFLDLIEQTFAETAHVEVHSFVGQPAGPHRRGSFEVLFTREAFADCVSWLMFARPPSIDVLVHPLTRSQVLDHTARALWLGTPRELDVAMLAAVDDRLAAAGRSEEAIIEATKRH